MSAFVINSFATMPIARSRGRTDSLRKSLERPRARPGQTTETPFRGRRNGIIAGRQTASLPWEKGGRPPSPGAVSVLSRAAATAGSPFVNWSHRRAAAVAVLGATSPAIGLALQGTLPGSPLAPCSCCSVHSGSETMARSRAGEVALAIHETGRAEQQLRMGSRDHQPERLSRANWCQPAKPPKPLAIAS